MAGLSTGFKFNHHALSTSAIKQHDKMVQDLSTIFKNIGNPFTEDSENLLNLVTKAVLPEDVTNDICQQSVLGQALFDDFVQDRIKSNNTSLWAPLKKYQLKTWKTCGKKVKLKVDEKVLELKEDRSLFARMSVVSKSRKDINLEEIIGKYELSVVPRSLFTADGQLLPSQGKSKLMSILESLPDCQAKESDDTHQVSKIVAIVDGMAEVQSLNKPDGIKTCAQLADHFSAHVLEKYDSMDEIHIVFDRYDIDASLKQATRVRRLGNQMPIAYHITDSTNISKVPMKKLLAHSKTKEELTNYLSEKLLHHGRYAGKNVVVA